MEKIKKIRTGVSLMPEQILKLKNESRRLAVSVSSLVRISVDSFLKNLSTINEAQS